MDVTQLGMSLRYFIHYKVLLYDDGGHEDCQKLTPVLSRNCWMIYGKTIERTGVTFRFALKMLLCHHWWWGFPIIFLPSYRRKQAPRMGIPPFRWENQQTWFCASQTHPFLFLFMATIHRQKQLQPLSSGCYHFLKPPNGASVGCLATLMRSHVMRSCTCESGKHKTPDECQMLSPCVVHPQIWGLCNAWSVGTCNSVQ